MIIVIRDSMERLWSQMDAAVAGTPMPQEYADVKVRPVPNWQLPTAVSYAGCGMLSSVIRMHSYALHTCVQHINAYFNIWCFVIVFHCFCPFIAHFNRRASSNKA